VKKGVHAVTAATCDLLAGVLKQQVGGHQNHQRQGAHCEASQAPPHDDASNFTAPEGSTNSRSLGSGAASNSAGVPHAMMMPSYRHGDAVADAKGRRHIV